MTRLLAVLRNAAATASNPQDRTKFYNLIDCAGRLDFLPVTRMDYRADFPSRRAVVFAQSIRAIRMNIDHACAAEMEPVVAHIERVANTLDGYICGSQDQGFWISFDPPREPTCPKYKGDSE
jgi:hypothetical protein